MIDDNLDVAEANRRSRAFLETRWNNGIGWCDAKTVLPALREFVQSKGFSPHALADQRIIDAMEVVPVDVIEVLEQLKGFVTND